MKEIKCKQLICVDKKPETENKKIFFGEYGGYMRIDTIQFPEYKKLYEASESNTWFMKAINYQSDRAGWLNLPDHAQRMFKLNIVYQTLMDSGVTSIFSKVADVASLSEVQYAYSRVSIEESIHAMSYSNALDTVFGSEAKDILDLVYTDPIVKNRMKNEIDGADNFIQLCLREGQTGDDAKKSLLFLLGAAFFLEGVKFPFSFYTTWSINKAYGNSIQGISQLLRFIGWDEMTFHTVMGSTTLSILRKDKEQGFSHLFEWFDEEMYKLAKLTVKQELEWADYLLKDGSVEGFNHDIAKHFVQYWTDRRLKELGLQPIYNEKKSDIIDWFNKTRNLNDKVDALQETSATNYQKGSVKNDLDKFNVVDNIPTSKNDKLEMLNKLRKIK
jgi:ribonucleoside-diphosphate reductase beta chain